jgi:thiamine-phosphate pyrophosphorylase
MSAAAPACRIYLVTPPVFAPAAFASSLPRILACADVAALRLRMPGASTEDLAAAATALRQVTIRADIALLLDGDADLALRLGCDGVHVPANQVAAARRVVGDGGSVGAACGASRDDAMRAAEAGADYVAFGPVDGGDAVDRDTVLDWAIAMVVPCVVAGGIGMTNAASWAATGAEFLALGRALWDAAEGPETALRAIAARIAEAPRPAA